MQNIENVKKNVEALIGFFNLDPNRVLDIILDSFENNVWNHEAYVSLLGGNADSPQFKSQSIVHLMGFKFINLQESIAKKDHKHTALPKGLFDVAAILIKRKFIKLEEIWPYL